MAGEPIQRNEILVAYKQKEYREKMKRDGSGMEKKTYILLNAGGTEINGTDQSRGNGSKKSADSTDGAMLLPETCEECCGETHGLYHYVSEKNLWTANRAESYMESLYQYLREEHEIYIESGRDTLEAALPSEEVQKALKIDAQMRAEFPIRYTLSGPHTVSMDDTVHVMNLVEGRSARIESMDGSFAAFTVHYAETAIVPAAVGTYRIVPEEGEMIRMLVASVR